jgi:hypothetical protein
MLKRLALCLVSLGLSVALSIAQNAESDQQVKQKIIRESLAGYHGNCPCPYNTDRAGRNCGRRSAYSRPGGQQPLCYETDVSKEMVEQYRKRAAQKQQKL